MRQGRQGLPIRRFGNLVIRSSELPGTLGCAGLPSCQKNLALLAPWRLVFSLALFQRNPDDHPNRYAAVILPEEHEFLHPGEVPRLFRIGS